jgi:hypothetical protein
MKLGQTGIFMEGPEYSGRSNIRGEPPWALKEICPRGNNIVIIIFLVHDNVYIPY